jgi:hypothetical protein
MPYCIADHALGQNCFEKTMLERFRKLLSKINGKKYPSTSLTAAALMRIPLETEKRKQKFSCNFYKMLTHVLNDSDEFWVQLTGKIMFQRWEECTMLLAREVH